MHFWGENVVHLSVEQIPALLANTDEFAYLVVLFLDHQCQGFLRLSGCRLIGRDCPNALLRSRDFRTRVLINARETVGFQPWGNSPPLSSYSSSIRQSAVRHSSTG